MMLGLSIRSLLIGSFGLMCLIIAGQGVMAVGKIAAVNESVVDIATSLGISQASVTNMVQRLDGEGLLKYEKYRGLVLTTTGETLARNIARRHQLLTDFLKLLGVDQRVIEHDVEGMEHHISPSTLRAIEALTAQLKRRPALLARVNK